MCSFGFQDFYFLLFLFRYYLLFLRFIYRFCLTIRRVREKKNFAIQLELQSLQITVSSNANCFYKKKKNSHELKFLFCQTFFLIFFFVEKVLQSFVVRLCKIMTKFFFAGFCLFSFDKMSSAAWTKNPEKYVFAFFLTLI